MKGVIATKTTDAIDANPCKAIGNNPHKCAHFRHLEPEEVACVVAELDASKDGRGSLSVSELQKVICGNPKIVSHCDGCWILLKDPFDSSPHDVG